MKASCHRLFDMIMDKMPVYVRLQCYCNVPFGFDIGQAFRFVGVSGIMRLKRIGSRK